MRIIVAIVGLVIVIIFLIGCAGGGGGGESGGGLIAAPNVGFLHPEEEALLDWMVFISEKYYGDSWHPRLEDILWATLIGEFGTEIAPLSDEDMDILEGLYLEADGWFYQGGANEIYFVTTFEWEGIYAPQN